MNQIIIVLKAFRLWLHWNPPSARSKNLKIHVSKRDDFWALDWVKYYLPNDRELKMAQVVIHQKSFTMPHSMGISVKLKSMLISLWQRFLSAGIPMLYKTKAACGMETVQTIWIMKSALHPIPLPILVRRLGAVLWFWLVSLLQRPTITKSCRQIPALNISSALALLATRFPSAWTW